MYLKAVLFLIISVSAAGGILLWTARFDVAILLIIAIWAFARLYYLAFYVIEYYIDPGSGRLFCISCASAVAPCSNRVRPFGFDIGTIGQQGADYRVAIAQGRSNCRPKLRVECGVRQHRGHQVIVRLQDNDSFGFFAADEFLGKLFCSIRYHLRSPYKRRRIGARIDSLETNRHQFQESFPCREPALMKLIPGQHNASRRSLGGETFP